MNQKTLFQLYEEHTHYVSDKWTLYLTEYEKHLSHFRDKSVNLLEIGIQNGGSLEIWAKYFNNASLILGCDINPDVSSLSFEDPRIKVVIGDATDFETQKKIADQCSDFDIIIDDGSHHSSDIVQVFNLYFPLLQNGGLFIVEDLHCSYWDQFEGGLYHPASSISFFKKLSDVINQQHWGIDKEPSLKNLFSEFPWPFNVEMLEQIHSVTFINSLCMISKQSPEDNRLGRRVIVGQVAQINSDILNSDRKRLIFDQSDNPFSLMSPLQMTQQKYECLESSLADRNTQIASLESSLADREVRIASLERDFQSIISSRSWKLTSPLRRMASKHPIFAKQSFRLLKLSWWTLTLKLPPKLKFQAKERIKFRRISNLINNSGLFDTSWYLEQYPDVREAGSNPLAHFIQFGAQEGRNPNPLFDTSWYLAQNPDVAKAFVNPLQHFIEYGAVEGRDPNPFFDTEWYLFRYPDAAHLKVNPLKHYITQGEKEGRNPNPFFDANWYSCLHGLSEINSLEHFIVTGEDSGYSPHPLWSETCYLKDNDDVARVVSHGEIKSGYRHFILYGSREIGINLRTFSFFWGNKILYFDPLIYLEDNPDVGVAIANGKHRNGLEHLFSVGYKEALDGIRVIYGPRHAVKLLQDLKGEVLSTGKHLCLFAHYDRDALIDPYVITYLTSLQSQDVDIVFITATATPNELDKVRPFVKRILVKTEAGRDFGSWWLALNVLGLNCGQRYDRVIFANDSIYFPVRPIEPLFIDMIRKNFNLYGLSDSLDQAYHIQSFFLAFDHVAQKVVFPYFFDKFSKYYLMTKDAQIKQFEFGITSFAQSAGLSVGSYFSINETRENVLHDHELIQFRNEILKVINSNPTHYLWDLIISRYGFPGIKIELLRDNPLGIKNLEDYPSLILDGKVKVVEIINHQTRIKKQSKQKFLNSYSEKKINSEIILKQHIKGGGTYKARRLVLFSHYDKDSLIDNHVIRQISSLSDAECSIVFITSTQNLNEINKIINLVRDVIIKNDVGRDFGSWFLAVRTLQSEFDNFDFVIWMNDSTFFPLYDPSQIFHDMERKNFDFWGMVDSNNKQWHIMSWFWAFGSQAIKKGWMQWILNNYNSSYNKWDQIINIELRLPRLIKESGLRTGVLVESNLLRDFILLHKKNHPRFECAVRNDFSMTHDFWEEIITEFHLPFLKVELVRDNPLRIDLSNLFKVIHEKTDYDPDLIRQYLLRIKSKHLPPPNWEEIGFKNSSCCYGVTNVGEWIEVE